MAILESSAGLHFGNEPKRVHIAHSSGTRGRNTAEIFARFEQSGEDTMVRFARCLEIRGRDRISTSEGVVATAFSDQRGSVASKLLAAGIIVVPLALVAFTLYDTRIRSGDGIGSEPISSPTQIVQILKTPTPTILRPTEVPATATSIPTPDNKCPLPSCDKHWDSTTNVGAITDAMSSGWVFSTVRTDPNFSGKMTIIDAQGKTRQWKVTSNTTVVFVKIRDDRYSQPGASSDPTLFTPGIAIEILGTFDSTTGKLVDPPTASAIKVQPRS